MQKVGDIKGETGISTSVVTGILPVHPQFGHIVRTLEMQDIVVIFQKLSINCDGFVIPDVVVAGFITDPAHFSFICKRHFDRELTLKIVVPFFRFTYVVIVKSEISDTIQVFPVSADKLGAGIVFYVTLHAFFLRI